MHQEREQGDLLDDAPNFEWEELKKMANNRDAWRAMVHRLRDGNGVKITITPTSTHNMTTRRRRRAAHATQPTTNAAAAAPTATAKNTNNNGKKYHDRDTHEAFLE